MTFFKTILISGRSLGTARVVAEAFAMSTAVPQRFLFCVSALLVGCSGPSGGATPTAPSTVASLSLALEGAPSLTAAQSPATYPIVLHAYRSDGTLIVGSYAQQVVVVLDPPLCVTGLGLQGGSPPTQPVTVPVTPGICGPGFGGPDYSSTAVMSSSDSISLTWNGSPIGSSGTLSAYAKNVPEATLTFP
jgi:hypothetical protein